MINLTIQKLNSLREEADKAVLRAEEAEAKIKILEQALLEKDHVIITLTHQLDISNEEIEEIKADFIKPKEAPPGEEQSK